MLGGGQLGRMFCHAAQSLGYRVAVLDPAAECPAGVVADRHIRAAYDDPAGLAALAELCPAVSTEFENVPADSLRMLAARCRVSPSGDAVAVAQDRNAEKAHVSAQGIDVAPNVPVLAEADLHGAPDSLFPGILKAARLGYDGKGQARVATRAEALQAYAAFGGVPCVLEALMPLAYEISVVLARGFDGADVVFPVARNVHRDGILAVSTVADAADPDAARRQDDATRAARAIARGLDYHGVLCVEFFVLQDGRLVVNEIAPRPHNSGHYTIDACVSSQFEQQARVMAGLPLGSTRQLAPAIMLNILGDLWFPQPGGGAVEPDWAAALAAAPEAKLHLYGKREARAGRKMGHITLVGQTLAEAQDAAGRVARILGMPSP